MGKVIGFDLGSAFTSFCIQDEKEIRTTPSVVALDKKAQRVIATGNDAKKMTGRAPGSISVVRPVQNGIVTDIPAASELVSSILERLDAPVFKHIAVVAAIPYGISGNDENAFFSAINNCGAKSVDFVYSPLAIALGAGMPLDITTGRMIVDIGAGRASASIISHGGVVATNTIMTAGDAMTEAVKRHISVAHGIEVGELTAETVKVKLGTLDRSAPQRSMTVVGKVSSSNDPKNSGRVTSSAVITSHELIPVLAPYIDNVISIIAGAFEKTPPEISSDISSFGILLSGGGAMINGTDKYIERALHVKVTTTQCPSLDTAKGILRIINGGRTYAKFTR